RRVAVELCELCLSGTGGECHTPGCALWFSRAPDVPVTHEPVPADQADHAETLGALNQATRERDEARAEVERLHSWVGLLELLDEHWPADIFIVPDTPDDAMHTGRHRDTGPIILGLIRWVDRLKSEHAVLDRV